MTITSVLHSYIPARTLFSHVQNLLLCYSNKPIVDWGEIWNLLLFPWSNTTICFDSIVASSTINPTANWYTEKLVRFQWTLWGKHLAVADRRRTWLLIVITCAMIEIDYNQFVSNPFLCIVINRFLFLFTLWWWWALVAVAVGVPIITCQALVIEIPWLRACNIRCQLQSSFFPLSTKAKGRCLMK